MPTYGYKCSECGNLFELRQGFDADSMTDCPKCGHLARRHINAVPVMFKGSGWYVNDYGRKNSGGDSSKSENSEKSEKSEKSDKSEKSEKSSKSDSKAEPAKESKKTSASKEK